MTMWWVIVQQRWCDCGSGTVRLGARAHFRVTSCDVIVDRAPSAPAAAPLFTLSERINLNCQS